VIVLLPLDGQPAGQDQDTYGRLGVRLLRPAIVTHRHSGPAWPQTLCPGQLGYLSDPVCCRFRLWCYRSAVLIVTGSVQARPDSIDHVLALSIAHVRRSRQEPGCLAHAVHRDCEDALRLVFVEHWADADALRAHFRVPASGAFVQEVSALAASPPEISIYEAHALSL
jgi:quinol monooxygenase YgiN